MKVYAIDLFCGVGGFTLGLLQAGIHVLGGLDSSPSAAQTYEKNLNLPVHQADIRNVHADELCSTLDVSLSMVDLIVGAPPLQRIAFARTHRGRQEQSPLILEFARIVTEIRPRMFLMECDVNVRNKGQGWGLEEFNQHLIDAGYQIQQNILNAVHYHVPQARRRLYSFGQRCDQTFPFTWPFPVDDHMQTTTLWSAIGDLPPPPSDVSLAYDPLHYGRPLSLRDLDRLHNNSAHHMEYIRRPLFLGYSRLKADRPAPALNTEFIRFSHFVHPHEDRNLTLREGARLQTFSDDFDFTIAGGMREKAKLIGGATPPLLAYHLGNALYKPLYLEARTSMLCSERISRSSQQLTHWGMLTGGTFQLLPTVAEDTRILLNADGMSCAMIVRQMLERGESSAIHWNGNYQRHQSPTVRVDFTITRYQQTMRLHELMGLCYEDSNCVVRVTELGKVLLRWLDDINEYNAKMLCWHAIQALSVCQLASPLPLGQRYAKSVKVFPFRSIWRAMLALDNWLSVKELNQVLLQVTTMNDLDPAIGRIAQARVAGERSDPEDSTLPDPSSIFDTHTWMSLASFGWVLIVPEWEGDLPCRYHIRSGYRTLIAHGAALQSQPQQFTTVEEYMMYLEQASGVPEDVR